MPGLTMTGKRCVQPSSGATAVPVASSIVQLCSGQVTVPEDDSLRQGATPVGTAVEEREHASSAARKIAISTPSARRTRRAPSRGCLRARRCRSRGSCRCSNRSHPVPCEWAVSRRRQPAWPRSHAARGSGHRRITSNCRVSTAAFASSRQGSGCAFWRELRSVRRARAFGGVVDSGADVVHADAIARICRCARDSRPCSR